MGRIGKWGVRLGEEGEGAGVWFCGRGGVYIVRVKGKKKMATPNVFETGKMEGTNSGAVNRCDWSAKDNR